MSHDHHHGHSHGHDHGHAREPAPTAARGHDHDHDHGSPPTTGGSHDHSHAHLPQGEDSRQRLKVALALTGSFLLVEAAAGWWTGSLALLADAGHMLSDSSGLVVALLAARLAARPPDSRRTLGWRRAEVLGATLNSSLLLMVSALIAVEAVQRLWAPQPMDALPMMGVASLGLLLNAAVAMVLMRGHGDDLNLRAALWHVVGDLLGSVGAVLAGLIAWRTGSTLADPAVSLLLAGIIAVGALRILRETADVLMESAPASVSLDHLRAALLDIPGVRAIHDLHLWSLAPGANVLSVHVVVESGQDPRSTRERLEEMLRSRLSLDHLTIQMEQDGELCRCCPEPVPAREAS